MTFLYDKYRYILLGSFVAFIVFSFSVFLPNFSLVWTVGTSSASFAEKFSFIVSLYGAIQTNFTFISASYTILIALLFGLNIALLAYFIRTRSVGAVQGNAAVGIGGLVSGIFGIGCAACGTFILSAVLGLFGATALLTFLPLRGEEFGILGVLLLGYTAYALLKKMKEPAVCSI